MTYQGTVTQITYRNQGTNWTVFKFQDPKGKTHTATAITNIQKGEQITIEGDINHHPKFGTQIVITQLTKNAIIKTKSGIEKLLATIPSIGEHYAEIIYKQLGQNTIKEILENPKVLNQVQELPIKLHTQIIEKINERKETIETEQTLFEYGFGPALQQKIQQRFGEHTKKILEKDPYKLLEVSNIGFISLDKKLLANNKIEPTNPYRLQAALQHVFQETCKKYGHTIISEKTLKREFIKLNIEITEKVWIETVTACKNKKKNKIIELETYEKHYTNEKMLYDETLIAEKFAALNEKIKINTTNITDENLNTEQKHALKNALTNRLSIITGGPGTGKTFTIKKIISNLKHENIILCAPTGKAAKRIEELTGEKARTIHSLIANLHKININNTTIIIDEVSMISANLMADLFKNINHQAIKRMVLVGDDNQLPSIDPGAVLQDSIESQQIPTVKLTKLMRQAEKSFIARNAKNIKEGKPIELGEKTNFWRSNIERGVDHLLEKLQNLIPTKQKKSGENYDLIKDVQITAPTYKGEWGCINLNEKIQQLLNPPSPTKKEITLNNQLLREGDKIIITENNYNLGVVNGDIGIIKAINEEPDKNIEIYLNGTEQIIKLRQETLRTIKLAYAITIHKMQGSEAPLVITIIPKATPPILRKRNLLYTAITRAQEQCWLIDDANTTSWAIKDNSSNRRQTMLKNLIITQTRQQTKEHNQTFKEPNLNININQPK